MINTRKNIYQARAEGHAGAGTSGGSYRPLPCGLISGIFSDIPQGLQRVGAAIAPSEGLCLQDPIGGAQDPIGGAHEHQHNPRRPSASRCSHVHACWAEAGRRLAHHWSDLE